MMKTSEALREVKALIHTPKKWTKETVQSREKSAYCLAGAIFQTLLPDCWIISINQQLGAAQRCAHYKPIEEGVMLAILQYAPKRIHYKGTGIAAIIHFNDHPKTTHKDVMTVLNTAIRWAEAMEEEAEQEAGKEQSVTI